MTVGASLAAAWQEAVAATSPLEALAAVLGVGYVILAIRQSRSCWAVALASTALYLRVFFAAGLYMQAGLQLFYVVMALYGWWAWRRGAAGAELAVSRAGIPVQLAGLAGIAAATYATADWLARETASAHALLDSLTTWASVFTTWLMTRKKLENWAWWLVVDGLIVILCWQQRLYASMILYLLYVGLVVVGWHRWKRDMREAPPAA
jgi:nicotinamide mononucleotide transporter